MTRDLPLKHRVYQDMRQRLISGELKVGSQLSELKLSREFGISRSSIREAISKLIHEGICEQMPGAIAVVREPSRNDIYDLYEVREWIEGESAFRASQKAPENVLAEMKKACSKMRAIAEVLRQSGARQTSRELEQQLAQADLEFHASICRGSGNRRALKLMSGYRFQMWVWTSRFTQRTLRDLAILYRQHVKVYRAVLKGRGNEARQMLRNFIREGREQMLKRIEIQDRAVNISQEEPSLDFGWVLQVPKEHRMKAKRRSKRKKLNLTIS